MVRTARDYLNWADETYTGWILIQLHNTRAVTQYTVYSWSTRWNLSEASPSLSVMKFHWFISQLSTESNQWISFRWFTMKSLMNQWPVTDSSVIFFSLVKSVNFSLIHVKSVLHCIQCSHHESSRNSQSQKNNVILRNRKKLDRKPRITE